MGERGEGVASEASSALGPDGILGIHALTIGAVGGPSQGGVDKVTAVSKQIDVNLYTVLRPQVYTTLESDPPSVGLS